MSKIQHWKQVKSINLDIHNKCTLQCKQCFRQSDEFLQGQNKLSSVTSKDDWKKILNYYDDFSFCGQASDPIMHPLLPDYLNDIYKSEKLCVVATAVSHKPMDWYIKCFESNPNAKWIFGLDGLPEDSHKYRTNQDGVKLFDIMKLATKIVHTVKWQYIVFNYNQNDIEQARTMASYYNMELVVTQSNRWHNMEDLKPNDEFLPS